MLTPMKAIRAKCLDCCCGIVDEVRQCPCDDCPLHIYRFGHKPYSNYEMTPARQAHIEKLRNSKKSTKTAIEKTHEGLVV